jgi:hypothetical protein
MSSSARTGQKRRKREKIGIAPFGFGWVKFSGEFGQAQYSLNTQTSRVNYYRRTARALTHTHNDRLKRKGGKIKSKES